MPYFRIPYQSKGENSFAQSKPVFFQAKSARISPKTPEDDKKGIDMPELAKSPTSDTNTPSPVQSFFRPIPLAVQRRYKVANDLRKMGRSAGQPSHSGPALPVEKYLRNIAGGEELNKPERSFFESRMNADFSSVKLHTDRLANESAEGIQALAYTHGNHIVFGSGQYQSHQPREKTDGRGQLEFFHRNSCLDSSGFVLKRYFFTGNIPMPIRLTNTCATRS